MKQPVFYFELKGTHREVGKQLARKMGAENFRIPAPANFSRKEIQEAIALYDKYCLGIKEELEGFAEEGNMKIEEMDTVEKRFSLCWFGQESNGWEDYFVTDAMEERMEEKDIIREEGKQEFFEMIPIPR